MATFQVTNNQDSGAGSLRDAIAQANQTSGADTIEFADSLTGQTITLTSGELTITDDLDITGLGANNLTISGNNSSVIFQVEEDDFDSDPTVTIKDLSVTESGTEGAIRNSGFFDSTLIVDGVAVFNNNGDGIINGGIGNSTIVRNSEIYANQDDGVVTGGETRGVDIENSIIRDNSGSGVDAGIDDGIRVINSTISGNGDSGISSFDGFIRITNSTIINNTTGGNGGGINAISFTPVFITNSTIANNRAGGTGGGLYLEAGGTMTNSTVVGNTANNSGGVFNSSFSIVLNEDVLNLNNNIIAGNQGENPDISGIFVSNGNNIIGNVTGAKGLKEEVAREFFDRDSSLTQADFDRLSEIINNLADGEGFENDIIESNLSLIIEPNLANNGGSTLTYNLVSNSIAIDAGANSDLPEGITTDQRGSGFARIVDGDGNGTVIVDIGAIEFSGSSDPDPDPDEDIIGTNNSDRLLGTVNPESIFALDGDDTVKGFGGEDSISGGNGNDTLRGNAGNDRILGGFDNDLISGNNDDDILFGEAGSDTLRGDAGNDTLDGGNGNDILFGGNGSDRFVLAENQGSDRIKDFVNGTDLLVLSGGLQYEDIEIIQQINGTEIRVASSNEILATLNSVTANALNADDFLIDS